MASTKITSITEVIDAAVTSRLSDTYHMLPGIVKAYYPATQEADIQIAINDPRFDPDSDELATEPWPIYPKMRVVWPRFAGMVLIGQLNAGDKVECMFQDLDDSNFRTTGQQGDPPRTRRHSSDGAYCLPWDLTDAGAATDNNVGLVIGKDGAAQQIRINGTNIQLGRTGGDFVALAGKVATELGKISAALAGLAVPITGPAGTTAVVSTSPYTTPGNTASSLVKCD